ncbi:MAG TPA: DUF2807 domain-containing protein [Acidimicrobiia bacterium]|nr:DUF2807 domain-containing protein [Acidimicrobiia bacterium]
MRQSKTLVGVVLVLALTAVGCASTGSGDIVSEPREVGSFDQIEVSSGIAVEITVDPAAAAGVTSIYDDNLQDKIITEVSGDTLVVEVRGNVIAPGSGRMVRVAMPVLIGLAADGGATVHGVGAADEVELRAEGGAAIDLEDMVVQTMDIGLEGGSKATVNAMLEVTGRVTGGATLTLTNSPASRDLDVSGGGKVSG